MIVSIFNDVIGPVMRGPSSSHCAAALRIGRLARDLMDGELNDLLVEFDRSGSLPTTHESQGSDMGLFGGFPVRHKRCGTLASGFASRRWMPVMNIRIPTV
jgi:iron-sulfur-dependent L-serine dehydratase beta subunit